MQSPISLATPTRALTLLAAAALLSIAPDAARADTVMAGSDLLFTPAPGAAPYTASVEIPPLPAGYFGAGSDAFPGVGAPGQPLMGIPLLGTPDMAPGAGYGIVGQSDTIVRRPTDAPVNCPGSITIPIEIVALNLVSTSPITVSFNGGASFVPYEVRVCLSLTGPQNIGQMNINHTSIDGGTFSSVLPVRGRLIFTKCNPNAGPGVTSPADFDPHTVTLMTPAVAPAVWAHTPMGLPVMTSPGGMVDHDCRATTPPIPYPATTNFFPGVGSFGGDCANPGIPQKELTREEEMLAKHGVLPPNRPPGIQTGFGDGSMGPCPCGNISAQPGRGCQHSESAAVYGGAGALLFATGSGSRADDAAGGVQSVVLRAIEMRRPPTICVFWQGTAALAAPVFSGDGDRFIGGMLRRIGTKAGCNGKASYGALLGDVPVTVQGLVPAAGGVRVYQVAFRDGAPAFCTPESINWTDAVQIPWGP